MSQEVILIASAVLGVILVPSLITVRPRYPEQEDLQLESANRGSQTPE